MSASVALDVSQGHVELRERDSGKMGGSGWDESIAVPGHITDHYTACGECLKCSHGGMDGTAPGGEGSPVRYGAVLCVHQEVIGTNIDSVGDSCPESPRSGAITISGDAVATDGGCWYDPEGSVDCEAADEDDQRYVDESPEDDADAQEPEDEYDAGGYMRVAVGDLIGGSHRLRLCSSDTSTRANRVGDPKTHQWAGCGGPSYLITSKLGWGHFSTVWRCTRVGVDGSSNDSHPLAIKVLKSNYHYYDAAIDEAMLFRLFVGEERIAQLVDAFELAPTNSKGSRSNVVAHACLIFPIYGGDLLSVIRRHGWSDNGGGLPMSMVRTIAGQLAQGLSVLHRKGIVHSDLKPENVMLERLSSEYYQQGGSEYNTPLGGGEEDALPYRSVGIRVRIIDLGNAYPVDAPYTDNVQTRQYMAPEVLVGAPFTEKIDCWSLACIVFEMMTGDLLFTPKHGGDPASFSKDEDHLAQMVELMGELPRFLLARGRNIGRYVRVAPRYRGATFHHITLNPWSLPNVLADKYNMVGAQCSKAQPPKPPAPARGGKKTRGKGGKVSKPISLIVSRGAGTPVAEDVEVDPLVTGAIGFLERLLVLDPTKRCDADIASQDPWVTPEEYQDPNGSGGAA